MHRTSLVTGLALCFSLVTQASVEPHRVPRGATQTYRKDGLFEGGRDNAKANLEDIRMSEPNDGRSERWIIDFSNPKRIWGSVAPKFQLSYSASDRMELPEGKTLIRQQAKFTLLLQAIQHSFVSKEQLQDAIHKSRYVKNVIVYPPVENGDMAVEIILREDVLFEPYQPMEREGRLVLDLRDAPQTHL
jgi:hypothetical protein